MKTPPPSLEWEAPLRSARVAERTRTRPSLEEALGTR